MQGTLAHEDVSTQGMWAPKTCNLAEFFYMTKINFKTKFGINQSVEYLGDIKFLSFGVIKSQKNQREL